MNIRNASLADLEAIHQIEYKAFLAQEACSKEKLKERLKTYPNHFYVLVEKDKIIAFINGFTTDKKDLADIMYKSPSLHDEEGEWQMVFGFATRPIYQHRGYGTYLMKYFIDKAKEEGRKGIVLTCKEKLIPYYEKFGYQNEGVLFATRGDVKWYQMRLTF